jgi:hypothetical protein
VVCLNISLLHPYTFFVNLGISGGYLVYMLWQRRDTLRSLLPPLAVVLVIGVALNMYFLLPLASMGTVSKDAIADTVTPTKADYTAIVDVANTGTVFTGLALSKNIFLDFDFYNDVYQNIYYVGTFLLYVILIALFLNADKRLSTDRRRLLIVCFGAFLMLVALATVTIFNLDILIKALISLPGGWAFRSPLKWQLYIPLVLFTMLVIVVAATKDRLVRRSAIGLLIVSFVLMNGYQLFDVMKRQLTPRSLTYFASLAQQDLNGKNLLFVNSPECIKDVLPYNSPTVTELNQIFASENVQVKRAWADRISSVNLSAYDYVLTCRRNLSDILRKDYAFIPTESYLDSALQLYSNQNMHPAAYATDTVYSLDTTESVNNKNAFITNKVGKGFDFVPTGSTSVPVTPLRDAFAGLTPAQLNAGVATATIGSGSTSLLLGLGSMPLYVKVDGNTINLSGSAASDMKHVETSDKSHAARLPLTHEQSTVISYAANGYDFKNLIANPSLEQGLWQEKPNDCLAGNTPPDIAMKLSDQHSDGRSSLQLEASRHIACSGPAVVAVKPGEHYLLSFDYQSPDGPFAGYYVGFEGTESSFDRRLSGERSGWQAFSQEITIPSRATGLRILFYGYPDDNDPARKISRFDNVHLIHIPPLENRFYLVASPRQPTATPRSVDASMKEPTNWQIKASGVTMPFYLVTKETYHLGWQLFAAGGTVLVPDKQHFAINGTMNAWYIDPAVICRMATACSRASDGTYTLDFAMKFKPQQWFYMGGIGSIVAAVAGVAWYMIELRGERRRYRR